MENGLSAVKLRPELLTSIVRPEPFASSPPRPATLYRTSRCSGKRILARRSEMGPFGSRTPPYDLTVHNRKLRARPAFGTVQLVLVNVPGPATGAFRL
jgi:hypothetical protein